jgi:phosphoglycolate phosphatase-like HAD superfamily hydrolase
MILLLPIAVNVNAQELDPPKEYDQLLEDYRDMYDIAQKYKKLYEEAEKDVTEYKKLYNQAEADVEEYRQLYKSAEENNRKLIDSNNRLQDLIDTQKDIIDDILNKKEIGIITGVNVVPANIKNSGIILGFDFQF